MSFERFGRVAKERAKAVAEELGVAVEKVRRKIDPETETVRALNLAGELLAFSEKMQKKIEEIRGEFGETYEELEKVAKPEDGHTIRKSGFGTESDVLTPVGTFITDFEYVSSFRFKEHMDDLKKLTDIKANEFLKKESYKRIEKIFGIFSGYMEDEGLEKDLDAKRVMLASNLGSVEEFLKDKKNEGGEYTE